jgi:hypothetical protein
MLEREHPGETALDCRRQHWRLSLAEQLPTEVPRKLRNYRLRCHVREVRRLLDYAARTTRDG